MRAVAAGNTAWRTIRALCDTYVGNADPLTQAANAGAFLVWSSQPLYPLYVWFLVGAAAWPALLTWLSTPLFFAVPLVGRRDGAAGRMLFVFAGLANTLVSAKAMGTATAVGWFLVPCLILATFYFRRTEWKIAAAMLMLTAISAWFLGHMGAPFHIYEAPQLAALSHLNVWSVVGLSAYLVYRGLRARRDL